MTTWSGSIGRTAASVHTVTLWERFITGSGLTMGLTACVLLAVTLPIHNAAWAAIVVPVPLTALAGLALAVYAVLTGLSGLKAHVVAAITGMVLVLAAGVALSPGQDLPARLGALVSEMSGWIQAISTNEVRSGVPQFGMLMTLLAWTLGYGGGWLILRRHQGWPLVLMGAPIVLLVLSNIIDGRAAALTFFMGSSALLLIHLSTVRRLALWRRRRLSFDPFTVLSQSAFMLAFGLAAALLASGLPSPNVQPLGGLAASVERSLDRVEADFSRMFNGLPSRLSFKTLTYDDRLSFRGNPNLTDTLLFSVSGDDGTYWRARTYSDYTGSGWLATGATFKNLESIQAPEYQQRDDRTHYFRVHAATDSYLTGGLPRSVSESAEGLVHPRAPEDVLQLRLSEGRQFFPTRTNLRYASTGSLSVAGANDLRQAGTAYPASVTGRYLQLPATLPRRVAGLAWQITQEETNPYDAAMAISGYLSGMTYNLDINPPPSGRDGVDYFLFDLRQGYCDYFASSMVVMLRTLGIPARYVLGYASGAFDASRQEYRVLELNYHAWVEAYFPGYGWIPFEPTPATSIAFGGPGNNPISTPNVTRELSGILGLLDDEEEDDEGFIGFFPDFDGDLALATTPMLIAAIVAGAAGLLALAWYRVWWRLGRLERADELYAKLLRLASALGVARRVGQTPHEYAEMLAGQLPEHAADIRTIAATYAHRRYAAGAVSLTEVRHAEEAWGRLRWPLIRRLFGPRQTKPTPATAT